MYPNGQVVNYKYTANNGLPSEVTGNGTSVKYTYDQVGRVIREVAGNGSIIDYTYDGNDNILTKQTTLKGKVIASFNYEYNRDGTIVRDKSVVNGKASSKIYVYSNNGNLSAMAVD
ncbi:MAG: hypothetical protein ACRCUP_00040, partial [Mycoplasmatales bacterium]